MRGRAAAARRGACVAALEGGGDVAALPRMRAVDGREGAVPDREAHAVDLREDLGQRVRHALVDDDLADVRLLVEAVVAVAEHAQLRHPDGAAAVPLAGGLDRMPLDGREPGNPRAVVRGMGRRGGDRDNRSEGEGRDALHPAAMVPAIRPRPQKARRSGPPTGLDALMLRTDLARTVRLPSSGWTARTVPCACRRPCSGAGLAGTGLR